ncbi:MAG: RluA family pseudouridine synthase [Bacteroidota bacterium]
MQVIYEDNHLIVVNKPAGLLVQGDKTEDATVGDWIKKYIKDRYKKPGDVFLGTVHRLDRPVSGAVIFARTSKSLSRMNELFRDNLISKKYWAIVASKPPSEHGIITHYIAKDEERNISKALEAPSRRNPDAKFAETAYELIGIIDGRFLLEVTPKTGRPHQIRVQLASIGCPIVGDLKYGFPTALQDASIALHCHSLTFIHPVKKMLVTIKAETPDKHWWKLMKNLTNN